MRLDVIDGTYELFRAHYSKRPDYRGHARRPLKATVGMLSSLLSLLRDARHGVTHVAVAFDNPIRSFRNRLFADYKSDEGVEPELREQFDVAEAGVRALGVTVWSMGEWEADDALATAAHRYADEFEQIRIHTPDKDLGQCLRGNGVVQVDRRAEREWTEAGLRAARGFGPASVPDFLALTGDTADGFPGIDGFGAKGAAAVLGRFEHLENIPDDHRRWGDCVRGAMRLASALRDGMEAALLYRKLATLIVDVPLAETAADLAWRGVPRDRFLAWCDEVGLESGLRERALQGTG